MAPEQQQALEAVAVRGTVLSAVDGRADIYALGGLLYEMLAGRPPEPAAVPARELRRLSPIVSVGLADIVGRCLLPDAEKRYPSAADLATDLRRHMADLPLRGVPNRSVAERFAKWRRRHRLALPALGLLLIAAVAGGAVLDQVSRHSDRARAALHEGHRCLDQEHYAQAHEALAHGIALLDGSPFDADLRRRLHEAMRRAEQGQAVEELHRYAERVRPLYTTTSLPEVQTREVLEQCRRFWLEREAIHQVLGPPRSTESGPQVRLDLLDIAILQAHLGARLAPPGEVAAVRREALRVLEEAEALFGPSCVLCRERQAHAEALRLTELAKSAARQAEALPPQSAWDHLALGLIHFRADDYRRAGTVMERAVALEPGNLWANFYRGSCAYRLEHHQDAVTAFSVCVALAPGTAWCYLNRGLAEAALGHLDRALGDYDRALELDPTLAAAAFGRGVVCYRQDRLRDAIESLRYALRLDPGHEQAKALLDQLEHPH
jgi:tetratricopeptide (TPR) repeat protein